MTDGPRSAPPGFADHFFTSSSGIELSVRVWPADPPVSSAAPFVHVSHGGGFLGAHHFTPPPWIFPGFRARGYHVVSHSYRLAPQARLDDQVDDCLEALAWSRANLPSILGVEKVDVDRYVLYGDSAGGLLVTLMGLRAANPPPRAIINVYGIVDILGMEEAFRKQQQSSVQKQQPWAWTGEFPEEELQAFLANRDPANILTASTAWREMEEVDEAELSRRWGTDFKWTERIRKQAELHVWRSIHPKASSLFLTGVIHPEKFRDETELRAFIDSVSSLRVLKRRQVEGKLEYPPTALLHGTGDTAVPVQQSYDMAKTLREMGVPVIERYEEGEEHVFDAKYTVCFILPPFASLDS